MRDMLNKTKQNDLKMQADIFQKNLWRIIAVTRKYENKGVDVVDLISMGTIGLVKAITETKAVNRIVFANYATNKIEHEVSKCFIKLK